MKTFKDLGLSPKLIQGLTEMGILHPTEIQKAVIPKLMTENQDLVGQAQTGTGKTAAYGIPILERIDPKSNKVQALVLSPTRELCQQVAKQLFKYTKYTHKIFTEAVYGGEKIDIQIQRLTRPTHIVVATPGRLIDLQKKKIIDLSQVKILVLDEADEMLSMGFKKELNTILDTLSNVQNKWLFSATMPEGIRQIVNKYLSADAVKINTGADSVVNKNIEHCFLRCEEVDKLPILLDFLKTRPDGRGVIFCRTKNATSKLAKQLVAKNISADAIHGDLLQKERDKAMRAFKNESLKLLVATDLAARGIDVRGLAYVVHYQFPEHEEYYTHRSGRTARAGEEGLSLALVNSGEYKQMRQFEKSLNIAFSEIKQIR